MLGSLLKKFSGSHYRKFYKRAKPLVEQINQLEEGFQSLSDEQLRAKTKEFMDRYQQAWAEGLERIGGKDADHEKQIQLNKEILDGLLPEAFATAKNAARRLCELADRHAGGRLLATGGGGYNRDNLARAWTAVVRNLAIRHREERSDVVISHG